MLSWTFLYLSFSAHYVGVSAGYTSKRGVAWSKGLALPDTAKQFSKGFVPIYAPTNSM